MHEKRSTTFSIKLNAFYGCLLREILRYMHEPLQTIFNVVFSETLFFIILYSRNPTNGVTIMPGILLYTCFDVVYSNVRMTLFVGRLENTLKYQLSSAIPRGYLYFVYQCAALIRSSIIAAFLQVIFFFFYPISFSAIIRYSIFYVLCSITFCNLGIIISLLLRNWNSVGAVENYLTIPLFYLSGAFFSTANLPSPIRSVLAFNPIFHFANVGKYLYPGYSEFSIVASTLVIIVVLVLSSIGCLLIFSKGVRLLN